MTSSRASSRVSSWKFHTADGLPSASGCALVADEKPGHNNVGVLPCTDPGYAHLRQWLSDHVVEQRRQKRAYWRDLVELLYPTGLAPPRGMQLSTVRPRTAYHDGIEEAEEDGCVSSDGIAGTGFRLFAFPSNGRCSSEPRNLSPADMIWAD